MPKPIDVPGVGVVDFPDEWSDAQIEAKAQELMREAAPAPEGKSVGGFLRNLVSNTPEAIGGAVRGLVDLNQIARETQAGNPEPGRRILLGLAKAAQGAIAGTGQSLREKGVGGTAAEIAGRAGEYLYNKPAEAALDVAAVLPGVGMGLKATKVPALVRAGQIAAAVDPAALAASALPKASTLAAQAETLYLKGLKPTLSLLKRNQNTLGGDINAARSALAQRGMQEGIVVGDKAKGTERIAEAIDRQEQLLDAALSGSTATTTGPQITRGGDLVSLIKKRRRLTATDPGHQQLEAATDVAKTFITDPLFSTPAPGGRGIMLRQVPVQTVQELKKDVSQQIRPTSWGQSPPPPGRQEAQMMQRSDLRRAVETLAPETAAPNAALKELYPLEEAVLNRTQVFGNQDFLPWRGMVGAAIFGEGGGLLRSLGGAAIGMGINAPQTMTRGGMALNRAAQAMPGIKSAVMQAGRAGLAGGVGGDLLRDALLAELEAEIQRVNTEKP